MLRKVKLAKEIKVAWSSGTNKNNFENYFSVFSSYSD